MTRKLSAVFLLSLLLVAFLATSALANKKALRRNAFNNPSYNIRYAPKYGFAGTENNGVTASSYRAPSGVALGVDYFGPSAARQVGVTNYDYQHNCTMGRQIEHRNSPYIHVDWMKKDGTDLGGSDRYLQYQAYDVATLTEVFSSGGTRANGPDRAGYVALDAAWVNPAGYGIPACHQSPGGVGWEAIALFDFPNVSGTPQNLFTSTSPTDKYGWAISNGTAAENENIWPKIIWQIGTDTVLHMVTSESGGAAGDPSTESYYRRVGGYQNLAATWSNQVIIDTTMNINCDVAATGPDYDGTASGRTDFVMILWNAPVDYKKDTPNEYANQLENDVWVAWSYDQGASFLAHATGGPGVPPANGSLAHGYASTSGIGDAAGPGIANVTEYDQLSDWKAYCDMSALVDNKGYMHAVWGTRKWTDTTSLFRRQSAIWHWSDSPTGADPSAPTGFAVRSVIKAEYDTGGNCGIPAWGSDVAKMTISECDTRLYVAFTQFGRKDQPCYPIDGDNQNMLSDLWMTASDNDGFNWDRPQALTDTTSNTATGNTQGCTEALGNCNEEYWASMARYGYEYGAVDTLDIVYINDKAPGGVVQPESGIWTSNPVMWLRTPCRDVVKEPIFEHNAGTGLGECFADEPLVTTPSTNFTDTVRFFNTGLLDLTWSTTVNYETSPSGWMTLTPNSGTITTGLNNYTDVEFAFDVTGMSDFSTHVARVEITHNATTSPDTIPVCITVASDFDFPENAVLATTCKRIRVYNTGQDVDGASNVSWDYIDECDTFSVQTDPNSYLYDASPFVTYLDGGGDTLRWYYMFDSYFTDDDALRPLTPLTVDSNSFAGYSFATAEFVTAKDSAIKFIVEYYVPKDPDSCEFYVQRLKFFNQSASAINGAYIGLAADWDIPSDSAVDNETGFDAGRSLIYQTGVEYGQDDSTEALMLAECGYAQQSDQRMGGFAPGPQTASWLNEGTGSNAIVHSTGTMTPGYLFKQASGNTGFFEYTNANPDSQYIDLHEIVTFRQFDLDPNDTFCYNTIVATSRGTMGASDGLAQLQLAVDQGSNFITDLGIECPLKTCCTLAGDVNQNGAYNISDAVFIVNNVFKGGPNPSCCDAADVNDNGAYNISDGVYIINNVFKGGPAPLCGSAGNGPCP
jgi:hypothetical protein